jgi:solute carrier family 66 (lysosomal lysine-arginine transporter), member 1
LGQALDRIEEEEDEGQEGWVRNTVSVLLVCTVGAAGWVIAWRSGVWAPVRQEGQDVEFAVQEEMAVGAQILGYFSAVCYLG